mgnify:CR=1 FL=1
MRKRIFHSMLLLAIVTILTGALLSGAVAHAVLTERVHAEVRSEARIISQLLPEGGAQELFAEAGRANPATRLTLIAPDGAVLFDSVADPATMENHAGRPEVQLAMQVGTGAETRNSGTLGSRTYYYAMKLENGQILRMAAASDSIWNIFFKQAGWLLAAMLPVLAFAAWLAQRQTRGIIAPLLTLDLEHPKENDVYEELSPLLLRMDRQREEIGRQIETLNKKQQEFTAITENMREGLAVLDGNLQILSLNRSAAALFGVSADEVRGRYFLTLNRSEPLARALTRAAAEGKVGSAGLTMAGRSYQLVATPVRPERGRVEGVVLLALDVTEQKQAEALRREFTANVSHELKTPLTSMISYIDLLKNKNLPEEERLRYITILESGSNRLKHLIEDLFEVSKASTGNIQLDRMDVDLISLIKQVEMEYEALFIQHDLTIRNTFSKEKIVLSLDPQKTFRILENLLVNAGKYALEHTRVYVYVEEREQEVYISVKNISATELDFDPADIMERFQRGDKARNTEGSGLGLAIAKSFTVLQNGHMHISFDADLFKVELIFQKELP